MTDSAHPNRPSDSVVSAAARAVEQALNDSTDGAHVSPAAFMDSLAELGFHIVAGPILSPSRARMLADIDAADEDD